MYKIVPTKLAVIGEKIIKGRDVIAVCTDSHEADNLYETMVDMYSNAKAHGCCDAAIAGGVALIIGGLIAKGILIARDLKK